MDEPLEDGPNPFCVFFVDNELPVSDLVAEWGPTTHPHALLARGGDLVADPLANNLPLVLGEGQHDVQMHASHGVGGIERLGNGDKSRLMTLKQLDQLVKIQQRAGQPIDLVDHHYVYPTGLDIGQETLKSRAVE